MTGSRNHQERMHPLSTDFTTNQYYLKLWGPTTRFDWFYCLSATPSGNNFIRHHFFWANSNRSPFQLLHGYFLRSLRLVEIRAVSASKRLSILCSQPYWGNDYPAIMSFFNVFNKSQDSLKGRMILNELCDMNGSEDYADAVTIDRWL